MTEYRDVIAISYEYKNGSYSVWSIKEELVNNKDARKNLVDKSELEHVQRIAADRKKQINSLRAERDAYRDVAESWMDDYDKIKNKYEPLVAVLSASEGEKEEES